MKIMTNASNTPTYCYDNSSNFDGYCNTAYAAVSTVDTLKSIVDNATKKPDVRPDQRSALEVVGRQVVARYYKDGFYTDSKDLIPAIQSIDVFNENTVKVTFVNGDVQTATVQNEDPYFFEDGLLRCLVKEMIGKEGTAILSKLLSYATDFYNKAEEDKRKKVEEEARKKAKADKNYRKAQKHWAKKRAKERENRIQEMAEAIARAKEMKIK